MKNLFLSFSILFSGISISQINVYECGVTSSSVSPGEVLNGAYGFYRPCIEFGANYNFQFSGDVNKDIKASEYIHIKEGFHAGLFNPGKGVQLRITEKSLFDVAVMNYPDLNHIEKYKKVEFGVDLEGEIEDRIKEFLEPGTFTGLDPLNPFIADDMDPNTSELVMHATFIHPSTWTVKERDFFYYHEFEHVGNDWDDAINDNNDYLMRVRFSPPRAGEWEAHFSVTYDGSTVQLPVFTFLVNDNSHPGYVKVHSNKRNLERGGRILIPVGQNFPGPFVGVDIYTSPIDKTNKAAKVDDWQYYLSQIQSYINQGGRYIKTCETAYGNLLEFENLGNYYNRMHYAFENDKLLDMCEANDVLIEFNLLFQDVFMTYGQSGGGVEDPWVPGGYTPVPWDYGNYGPNGLPNPSDNYGPYAYFVSGTKPSNMFLKDELLHFHKQRTRYYIARYGYTPQIYMWELLSEPWHLDQYLSHKPGEGGFGSETDTVIKALDKYNHTISNFIKDELKDKDHLILGCAFSEDGNLKTEVMNFSSFSNPNIDVIGSNFYSPRPDKLIKEKLSKDYKNNHFESGEVSQYYEVHKIHHWFNKPLLLTEIGHGDGFQDCSNFTGDHMDVFTQGFTGIAGMYNWNGFDNQSFIWPHIISAQNHINGDDVINTVGNTNGYWSQGRQVPKKTFTNKDFLREQQYYLSENKELAVGYVKNRTYNYFTQQTFPFDSSACIYMDPPLNTARNIFWQDGNNIHIEGLKNNTDYSIDWYDFYGNYMSSYCVSSSSTGRFKLKFPVLSVSQWGLYPSNPAVRYVLKQQNCQGNRPYMEEDSINTIDFDEAVQEFNVYPNPFSKEVFMISNQKDEVEILSLNGILLDTFSIEQGRHKYNLERLASGIYFFHSKLTGKIIKVFKL